MHPIIKNKKVPKNTSFFLDGDILWSAIVGSEISFHGSSCLARESSVIVNSVSRELKLADNLWASLCNSSYLISISIGLFNVNFKFSIFWLKSLSFWWVLIWKINQCN